MHVYGHRGGSRRQLVEWQACVSASARMDPGGVAGAAARSVPCARCALYLLTALLRAYPLGHAGEASARGQAVCDPQVSPARSTGMQQKVAEGMSPQ